MEDSIQKLVIKSPPFGLGKRGKHVELLLSSIVPLGERALKAMIFGGRRSHALFKLSPPARENW